MESPDIVLISASRSFTQAIPMLPSLAPVSTRADWHWMFPVLPLELIPEFAQTPEGKWLTRNASLFGFILRYPQNKEDITGIPYEPWHIRYVTRELSGYLTLTGMTLEEYLDFPVKTKSASGFEKWKF